MYLCIYALQSQHSLAKFYFTPNNICNVSHRIVFKKMWQTIMWQAKTVASQNDVKINKRHGLDGQIDKYK